MSSLAGLPGTLRVMALVRSGKALPALSQAERLLRSDALNLGFLRVYMQAAKAAGLPEAAVHALELAREFHPSDAQLLRWLSDLYQEAGEFRKAREVLERLAALLPRDFDAHKALKDVTALASIKSDGWQAAADGGSYRDMIKDTAEASILEKEGKAVRSDRDTDELIRDVEAKVRRDPKNVNFYRELARLHMTAKQFDRALDAIRAALEVAPGDPELSASLSNIRMRAFDHEIALLRDAGDESAAQAREAERDQFRFDDLSDRVKRYPTDLRLRFEWGGVLLARGEVNDAIQQFQMSQRSPKHRAQSLYHMAKAFEAKEQYDLAIEQLQTAAGELLVMDQARKDVLYELGEVLERVGRRSEAAQYFKQVYQADISYRDVAQKVEKAYGSQGG